MTPLNSIINSLNTFKFDDASHEQKWLKVAIAVGVFLVLTGIFASLGLLQSYIPLPAFLLTVFNSIGETAIVWLAFGGIFGGATLIALGYAKIQIKREAEELLRHLAQLLASFKVVTPAEFPGELESLKELGLSAKFFFTKKDYPDRSDLPEDYPEKCFFLMKIGNNLMKSNNLREDQLEEFSKQLRIAFLFITKSLKHRNI